MHHFFQDKTYYVNWGTCNILSCHTPHSIFVTWWCFSYCFDLINCNFGFKLTNNIRTGENCMIWNTLFYYQYCEQWFYFRQWCKYSYTGKKPTCSVHPRSAIFQTAENWGKLCSFKTPKISTRLKSITPQMSPPWEAHIWQIKSMSS